MVNKKLVVLAMVAVMLIGAVTGGTMAVYQASTNTDKTITTSSIDVKLHVEGNKVDEDGNVLFDTADIKNGLIGQKVNAVNAGSREVYLRVKVTKAWYEGDEKVFERNGKDIDNSTLGIHCINKHDWIIPDDSVDTNQEIIYIYYKKILEAGEVTSDFMDAITILKDVNVNTNQYAGLSAKIKYDADSVQTISAKDVVLAKWGVNIVFDEDGNITSVTNQ